MFPFLYNPSLASEPIMSHVVSYETGMIVHRFLRFVESDHAMMVQVGSKTFLMVNIDSSPSKIFTSMFLNGSTTFYTIKHSRQFGPESLQYNSHLKKKSASDFPIL